MITQKKIWDIIGNVLVFTGMLLCGIDAVSVSVRNDYGSSNRWLGDVGYVILCLGLIVLVVQGIYYLIKKKRGGG